MHGHTPSIAVTGPRGETLGALAYCRDQLEGAAQLRKESWRYDAAGRCRARQDARLADAIGNLQRVFTLQGVEIASSSVDAGWRVALPGDAGQVLQAWDSRGGVRGFEFDQALRPVRVAEQAAGAACRVSERLAYGGPDATLGNQCGRLLRHEDPAGRVEHPAYGLLGQPIEQQRTFLASTDSPIDWPADATQRDSLLEPRTFVTFWWHDSSGALLEQRDASGHGRRYQYDCAGQLHAAYVELAGGAESLLASNMAYGATGQLLERQLGNGVRIVQRFTPASGLLAATEARKADGTSLQDLAYHYDPVGNVLEITQGSPVRYARNQRIEPRSTFRYDSLYQLIEATGREAVSARPFDPDTRPSAEELGSYTQAYRYDTGGNLVEVRHVGVQSHTRRMHVDASSNRLLPEASADFAGSFDANGNLLKLENGQALHWDVRNQLCRLDVLVRADGESDSEHYHYDAAGARLRKITVRHAGGVRHVAVVRYLPGLQLRTDTATGEELEVIEVGGIGSEVRVLRWKASLPAGISNDSCRYGLGDHLQSIALELDENARVLSREGYYPYGGTAWWSAAAALEASYRWTRHGGKERDGGGLYYYGMRYYAPWLMRWLNPDPGGEVDGLNFYRAFRNSPVVFSDPDGRAPATLLYGFTKQRIPYLKEHRSTLSELPLFTIDQLNAALSLPDWLDEDFPGMIKSLRNRSDPKNREMRENLKKAPAVLAGHTGMSETEVTRHLESWRNYLSLHADSLSISSLLKFDRLRQGEVESVDHHIYSFINKNLNDTVVDKETVSGIKEALWFLSTMKTPEEVLPGMMEELDDLPSILFNAFFRKTSKLALDWAQEQDIPTEFVGGEMVEQTLPSLLVNRTGKPGGEPSWPYQQDRPVHAFFPVTFSEMKHIQRKGYSVKNVKVHKS